MAVNYLVTFYRAHFFYMKKILSVADVYQSRKLSVLMMKHVQVGVKAFVDFHNILGRNILREKILASTFNVEDLKGYWM